MMQTLYEQTQTSLITVNHVRAIFSSTILTVNEDNQTGKRSTTTQETTRFSSYTTVSADFARPGFSSKLVGQQISEVNCVLEVVHQKRFTDCLLWLGELLEGHLVSVPV